MVDTMAKSLYWLLAVAYSEHTVDNSQTSIPFIFFISNDAFYFGILPLRTEAASYFGISATEMERAFFSGQPRALVWSF
jgi:citrate-Mg2+:H+ or citrate-Ca2+:H+ symporter, CitMHS family